MCLDYKFTVLHSELASSKLAKCFMEQSSSWSALSLHGCKDTASYNSQYSDNYVARKGKDILPGLN